MNLCFILLFVLTSNEFIFTQLNSWGAHAMNVPCSARQEDFGMVCVCNASYCDTIERPDRLPKGQYYLYSTSNSTPGFSQFVGHFSSYIKEADIVFTVNPTVPFQEFIGVGGAFTDSVGIVLKTLSDDAQDKLMQSYFGPNGIEYSMARVPIGGTDFSTREYTLDDIPFDDDLKHFNITYEDYNYKIPLLQKAKSLSQRGLKLLACSWFAPSWMKNINATGCGFLWYKYLKTWAQYHVKFLQAYKNFGLDFWAISGGNEPILPIMLPYVRPFINSTLMMAPLQKLWLKEYLSPQMKAANFSDVKFITLEDTRPFPAYWMERFADDPDALDCVDAIGLHWYIDFIMPPDVMDAVHEKYPDLLILYTESCINFDDGLAPVQLGSWHRAEYFAYNIIQNLNHWTQSYMDWNIALNMDGGPSRSFGVDASIIVNSVTGEFYKQPMFYVLGHLSKFVPPGARRILVEKTPNSSSQSNESYSDDFSEDQLWQFLSSSKTRTFPQTVTIPPVIEAIATQNPDGSYSVMVFNSLNTTIAVRIEDANVGSIYMPLESHSLNTFVYWL